MASVEISNVRKLTKHSYQTALTAPSYPAVMSLKHTNAITIKQLFSDSEQRLLKTKPLLLYLLQLLFPYIVYTLHSHKLSLKTENVLRQSLAEERS